MKYKLNDITELEMDIFYRFKFKTEFFTAYYFNVHFSVVKSILRRI